MSRSALIVDDDPMIRELLCEILEDAGFQVTAAKGGHDALEKGRQGHPDVIILDVMLPDLDGFAVCKMLRSEEETAGIPIIMLSGNTEMGAVEKSVRAGANRYLFKPVNPHKLVQNIRDVLGGISKFDA